MDETYLKCLHHESKLKVSLVKLIPSIQQGTFCVLHILKRGLGGGLRFIYEFILYEWPLLYCYTLI